MGFLSKIFGSKQKESKEIQIFSPLSGEIVNIEDVPDVVFSEKFDEDYEFFDNVPSFNSFVQSVSKGTIDNPGYQLITTSDYPEDEFVNSVAPKTKDSFSSTVKFELSEIITLETGNNITKSGLYHRFNKIKSLAQKIRD